jgi:spermidine/putrescine transport system substrate-binding protein
MAQLAADDMSKQVHKSEYLSKLQFMSAMPDERRQAFADTWEEVKAFYAR